MRRRMMMAAVTVAGWLTAWPALAQEMVGDKMAATQLPEHIMGPILGGRMLHAWLGLGAAVVIFFLTLGMMRGGRLAQPIFLIGLGVLADALIGVVLPPLEHAKWMWLGSLMLNGAIVVAVLWIAQIFGVFRRKPPS